MAIADLVVSITDATGRKMSTVGVFIDLEKAFDKINHRILVKNLEHYGIRDISSKWISSYLTNTKQYVNIEDMLRIQRNFMWCSAGFNTWTKLFIIYIIFICNISSTLKFRLFADETNICISG